MAAVCAIMRVRTIAASHFGFYMNVLQGNHRAIELLRYAGLFLWFCAGIPLALMHYIYPEPLALELYVAWAMLHILFGVMYWNLTQYLPERSSISSRLIYLSLLTGCALGISAVSQSTMGGVLLLIASVAQPFLTDHYQLPPFQSRFHHHAHSWQDHHVSSTDVSTNFQPAHGGRYL